MNHLELTLDNKQMACFGLDGLNSSLHHTAKKLEDAAAVLRELNLRTHPEARKSDKAKIKSVLATLINEYDYIDLNSRAYDKFLEMFDEQG